MFMRIPTQSFPSRIFNAETQRRRDAETQRRRDWEGCTRLANSKIAAAQITPQGFVVRLSSAAFGMDFGHGVGNLWIRQHLLTGRVGWPSVSDRRGGILPPLVDSKAAGSAPLRLPRKSY